MENRKTGFSVKGTPMHYSVGIILQSGDKYFLLDRVNPPFGFACPAGHIDEGEAPLRAALRELKEETGVLLTDLEFLLEEEVEWNYCKTTPAHYWYLYKTKISHDNHPILSEEAKQTGWFSKEEIQKLTLEPVWEYWFKKIGLM